MLLLLDANPLESSHFEDSSKEFSHDFIKTSNYISLFFSHFWVPYCSIIYTLSSHTEKYSFEVTITIFL